jgi:hypothetical protein
MAEDASPLAVEDVRRYFAFALRLFIRYTVSGLAQQDADRRCSLPSGKVAASESRQFELRFAWPDLRACFRRTEFCRSFRPHGPIAVASIGRSLRWTQIFCSVVVQERRNVVAKESGNGCSTRY